MNGPADLQKVWHDFVGNYFMSMSILDVGAGQGLSKDRLSINNNQVFTQDINRNLMLQLDIISELRDICGKWDLVTAFDVIEHVPRPISWLFDLKKLASNYIFITTPNALIYTNPWHYRLDEVLEIINKALFCCNVKIFARFKGAEFDKIEEWNGKDENMVNYFGFLISGIH